MPDLSGLLPLAQTTLTQLRQAATDAPSDFSFYRLRFPQHLPPPPRQLQAMVIGGTNSHFALISRQAGSDRIAALTHAPTPPLLNQHTLLEFIASHLQPQATHLALNFAFTLEPLVNSDLPDGIFITGSKEHPLAGLGQEPLAPTIQAHLRPGSPDLLQVAVANDLHCLLLAGLTGFTPPPLAALILGTGTNSGFISSGSLVNLESGNFTGFPHSPTLTQIDRASENPGSHLFEKATAGSYLYQHFNLLLPPNSRSTQSLASTKELNRLASDETHPYTHLARQVLSGSAALVAAHLAGIYHYLGIPTLPLLIEGSLYWQSRYYQTALHQHLGYLGVNDHIHPHRLENAHLLGAAALFCPPPLV